MFLCSHTSNPSSTKKMNNNVPYFPPLSDFSLYHPIFSERDTTNPNENWRRQVSVTCSYVNFAYRAFPYCEFDVQVNEFLLRAVQNGAFDRETSTRLFPFTLQALAVPRRLISFLMNTNIQEQNATIISLAGDLLQTLETPEQRQVVYECIAPRVSRALRDFVTFDRSFWDDVPNLLTDALESCGRAGFGAITVIAFYESNDLEHSPIPPNGTGDIPRLISSWNFLSQFRRVSYFTFRAVFVDIANVAGIELLIARIETILTDQSSGSIVSILNDSIRIRQIPLVIEGCWLRTIRLLGTLQMTQEPTERTVRPIPPLIWANLGQIRIGDEREPYPARADGHVVRSVKYSRFW